MNQKILSAVITFSAAALIGLTSATTFAASSNGCEGGGFSVVLPGSTIVGSQKITVPAAALGTAFLLRGRYIEITVDALTFGIRNYTMTGFPNALDIAGGVRTVVFASKTPDHRGLALTQDMSLELKDSDIVIKRSGAGLSMKVQAKDCANGGLFQMEPERADGTTTDFTHQLANGVFYFDNQNFRDREGDVVPYKDTTVVVPNRINFGNDISPKFVGRDSPQVATRINHPSCRNVFPNRATIGGTDTVQHCGGVSLWRVSSGGRMGQVMGEDATEVSPPATVCTQNCQAQNRVRGRAVTLEFPFPVAPTSRLQPRLP
jgi:hypothetical protein